MEKNIELENGEFEQFITERLASDIELLDENGVGKLMCELERNHNQTFQHFSKWFEEQQKLSEEYEMQELRNEAIIEEITFWKEFIYYLSERAIGDKSQIIDSVNNNTHNWFEGYVKVKKSIGERQEIRLTFELKNDEKYTAEWDPSYNYGVWQTCGISGDDYSGYMLFPTHKDDEYFCIYYTC